MSTNWSSIALRWRKAALTYFIATVLIAIQGIPKLFGIENQLLNSVGALGYLCQTIGTAFTFIALWRE